MRAFTIIIAALIIGTLPSCVQLPDLNPNSNENIIVSQLSAEWYIPNTGFAFTGDLDINGNGTVDFQFIGEEFSNLISGSVKTVKIQGSAPGNTVTRNVIGMETICNAVTQITPVQMLQPNLTVNDLTRWGAEATLFWNQTNSEECTDYRLYTKNNTYQFLGVKFVDEGNIHYGWIELKSQNSTTLGVMGSPERWRINRCAYNSEPGFGLRIPG